MRINRIFFFLIFSIFFLISLFSCSTGIEGTKTITYSRHEKKELTAAVEELPVADISPDTLKNWKIGKRFMISDPRASILFESNAIRLDSAEFVGKIIEFSSLNDRTTPGGTTQTILTFFDGNHSFSYPTGKIRKEAFQTITSLDVPMLIDLDLIEKYRQKLETLKVWTKSSLWYDEAGEKIRGKRYVPITIDKVSPGDGHFMIHLNITDENGNKAIIYMNPQHRGLESRTFSTLFFTSDPRLKYSSISPEVWKLICEGKVRAGMTKEECRLSLGNPDEVAAGHDWNKTVDIWNYKNGVFLRFMDGVLTDFRN